MTDEEYLAGKALIAKAAEIKEAVLAEAVARGDAYMAVGMHLYAPIRTPFLTLEEAQAFADSGDAFIETILAPGEWEL